MANAKNQNKKPVNKTQTRPAPAKPAPAKPARKVTKFFDFKCAHILRSHNFYNDNGEWTSTSFDVSFDDVITIYGCSVMWSEANQNLFISFPRKKGGDNRYWNIAWVALSNEDMEGIISAVMDDGEYYEKGFMDVDADEEIPFN